MHKCTNAFIFRKASSVTEIKNLTHAAIKKGDIESKCLIIDFIHLDQNEYVRFSKSLLSDCNFLKPYKNKTFYHDHSWKCVLVMLGTQEETGILVSCEGSEYARYSGLYSLQ